MRKLLLASSALFVLGGGLALAHGGSSTTTVTAIPVVKNAAAAGLGNSAATTGGTASSQSASDNAGNLGAGNSAATDGGTSTASNGNGSNDGNSWSSTKDAGNTTTKDANNTTTTDVAVVAALGLGNEVAAGDLTNERSYSFTSINSTLATSSNDGTVNGSVTVSDPPGKAPSITKTFLVTGDATMDEVNGGEGILTAQQNTGVDSLQQNSVALGSVVGGNGSGFSGSQ